MGTIGTLGSTALGLRFPVVVTGLLAAAATLPDEIAMVGSFCISVGVAYWVSARDDG
jgi:predicted ABC-type sugar transport system permease subunit